MLAHDLRVGDSRHALGAVGPHLGERLLIGGSDGLVVLRRVAERRDHRVLAPLRDVAQRVVSLLIGKLVDELVQTLLGRHASDIIPAGGRALTRSETSWTMAWPPEAGQPLQRAAEAVGVRERLADCSLNPESEFGAPKAHGFALILGIRLEHLDHLEAEIRSGILTTLVASVRENAIHRVNCVVDLPVRGLRDKQDRAVNTRTVWELADKDAAPRLVSAFVKP